MNLRELWEQTAQTRANDVFLVFEDPDSDREAEFTYAEFWAATCQAANMFWRRGVRPGDRVVVHLYNSVEFVECLFALAAIGAIIVPLNASYTPSEICHILRTCRVQTAVADAELLPIGLAANYQVDDIIVVGETAGYPSYEQLRQSEPERLLARPPIAATDPVEVMFTSGTTARPKGVTLTHYNFIFAGYFVNWQLAMVPGDRYLSTMAVTHINLQLSALMPAVTVGGALLLMRRYSATRFWKQVRKHRATLAQAMAMIVRTLLAQPIDPDEQDHQVREMHYFLPITDEEKAAFEDRFNVSILNNYGSTESLVGCLTDLPFGPRRWPSIGRVGLGYEARIVDVAGRELPIGEVGEIAIKGAAGRTLMAGYWCDPEATAKALDNEGWLHTSDYGRMDQDGWFYFVDRKIDLIKRAGENVSSIEVEDVLQHFPGVREAAVVGVPDSVRDEQVKAFILPDDGVEIDVAELLAHCSNHLAYYKVPTLVEICTDLPRGNYGKVQKNRLVHKERTCNGNQD
ncbi:MAG: AMP-binding protein [Brooklawnia sp.]|nr:AMP-binding protein [Brooklawnia sp.]